MKTVSTRDLQTQVSSTMKVAQEEPVIVTKHGNPAAIITGVEGKSWDEVIAMLPPPASQLAKKPKR